MTTPVSSPVIPGELLCAGGEIVINAGRETIRVRVANTSSEPGEMSSGTVSTVAHGRSTSTAVRWLSARAYIPRATSAAMAMKMSPSRAKLTA